ncbi:SseB family protein [Frondihabitans peucedani]|uniref:SseB protein N-terminal domain-containing protein n=1 Tax=Frondihabitans peucedani TaxID=598626 RepID=A0ABP8E473_9MICO
MTSSDDTTTPDDAKAPETTAAAPAEAVDTDAADREPTALETAILQGQAGQGDMNDVIGHFVNALVVVPTATEVTDDLNELQPVLFDREGTPMLAVFSHIDRIPEQVAEVASYAVQMPAAELVQAIPAETGLVVNPGSTEGFEMLPEGVQQLANDVRGLVAAMEEAQAEEQQQAPTTPSKIDPSSIPNF